MTITKTADVEGTLQQIYALAAAGCDIVRCTCNEAGGGRGAGPDRAPLAGADHRRHPPPVPHGARRARGRRARPAPQPRQHPQARAHQGRGQRGTDRGVPIRIGVNGGSLDPALYEKYGGITPEAMVESAQHGAGLLRRGRLRRRQDLGEGVERAADGRGLPPARRGHRPPAAPRRHRGRPAAGRAGQGHRRHRHAAGRGHRRHDPLLAHRRPGRGGARRPPAARGARPARAQERRPHRLPVVRAGRDRRDRRRQPGAWRRSASARSRCRSR